MSTNPLKIITNEDYVVIVSSQRTILKERNLRRNMNLHLKKRTSPNHKPESVKDQPMNRRNIISRVLGKQVSSGFGKSREHQRMKSFSLIK